MLTRSYATVSVTVTDVVPVGVVAVTTIVAGVPALPDTEVEDGAFAYAGSPVPSCPELLLPQHFAAPEMTAQV